MKKRLVALTVLTLTGCMSLEQEAALDECVAWANYEAKETPINRKWLNAEDEEWAKNDFINEIESSLKEPTRPTGESRICKWDKDLLCLIVDQYNHRPAISVIRPERHQ